MNAKLIKRIFIILIASFAVIFILRFVYELSFYFNSAGSYSRPQYIYDGYNYSAPDYGYISSLSGIQNISTAKQRITGDGGSIEINYDQKYEMISKMTAESDDFENDVGTLRKEIDDLNGVVQMENSSGLEEHRSRSLWISIGIPPGKFDLLVDKVKTIGNLTSFSVNKTDKTTEFRSYLAQREALEKTLESYNSLKTIGGSITDLLVVEQKIIEVEKEILQMGVTLGIYDESQSMCTVDFTLNEYYSVNYKSSIEFYMIIDSASNALLWTLGFYFVSLLFLLLTGFAAFGLSFLWNRITVTKQSKISVKEKTAQITQLNNSDNNSV